MQLELLRSFFVIGEAGSLNKAALRLRVSQSTLTRQMHALEQEIGGRLFERSSTGVALTAAGHALAKAARPALDALDLALSEARRRARGQSEQLRVGYLMSAAPQYLNPALAVFRREHPEVKVKLHDLSPGEQMAALRKGEIDVAILGSAGELLNREFYVRRLATLPVLVALPEQHRLAGQAAVRLGDLRGELFVGAPDADMPGHNRWVQDVCRRAGFRPKFVGDAESFTQGLSLVVGENAVALVPGYTASVTAPGVVFRPIRDSGVKLELLVAWQRGTMTEASKGFLQALKV